MPSSLLMGFMKRIGQVLKGFCLDGVVDFSQKADFKMGGPRYAELARNATRRAAGVNNAA